MITDSYPQTWESLEDEEYRREFSDDVGTGLAFQIRLLREKNGWTQEELAQRTGKQQETISQWENPNYGSYTLNSLKSLASAFDVALMVKFVPFSELVDWTLNLTPERLAPKSFAEESASSVERVLAANSIPLGQDFVWLLTSTAALTSTAGGVLPGITSTGTVTAPFSEKVEKGKSVALAAEAKREEEFARAA